jgi:hypothetical protein
MPQSRKVPARMSSFAAAFLFLLVGCHPAPKPPVAAAPPPVAAAAPLTPLKSPSGKTYARSRVGPADEDEPVIIPPVPPGAAPNLDAFRGTARACAKLSMASGTPQSFTDLADVLDSLPSDESMRAMNISKSADSCRLSDEQKLVTVTAFLYAASRESDNDFHCIVGRDPSLPSRFMNVEVSALPPSGSEFLAAIRSARNQFKAFFTANGDALPGSGYDKFDPPISITVTGSVFFDVDHVPPAVGPSGMKPQTAWEIHPVSAIQFEAQN